LISIGLAGCLDTGPGSEDLDSADNAQLLAGDFELYTRPAIYKDRTGLYEPTIDVGGDGAIYVISHSTGVGEVPATRRCMWQCSNLDPACLSYATLSSFD
jgi:hypothetical protein